MRQSVCLRLRAFALAVAAALALTACCGAGSSSTTSASSPAASSAPAASSLCLPTPTPDPCDGLEELLDGLIGFGPGTAGCSLASAGSAVGFLNWCAVNGERIEPSLTVRVEAWYTLCPETDRENLTESWPMVKDSACLISDDPDSCAELLVDAGVVLDPAQPDKESFDALVLILDPILLGPAA